MLIARSLIGRAPTPERQLVSINLRSNLYKNNPNWILGILNFKLEWNGLITDCMLLVDKLEIWRRSWLLIFRLIDVRDIYVQFAFSYCSRVCPKQPVRFSIMNSTDFIFLLRRYPNSQLAMHLFIRMEKIKARWPFQMQYVSANWCWESNIYLEVTPQITWLQDLGQVGHTKNASWP